MEKFMSRIIYGLLLFAFSFSFAQEREMIKGIPDQVMGYKSIDTTKKDRTHFAVVFNTIDTYRLCESLSSENRIIFSNMLTQAKLSKAITIVDVVTESYAGNTYKCVFNVSL